MNALAPDPLRGLTPPQRAETYARLHAERPVYFSTMQNAWVISRYEHVAALLRHPGAEALSVLPFLDALSARGGLELGVLRDFLSAMSLMTKPPLHDALRQLQARALEGLRRLDLPLLLGNEADRLLRAGARAGGMDLAAGYARPLALFTIGQFLGVGGEALEEIGVLAGQALILFERALPTVATLTALNRSIGALMAFFTRQLAARRRAPEDDGLSLMLRLAAANMPCEDAVLAAFCTFFFIAAEETTGCAIADAAQMLLSDAALRAQLKTAPSLRRGAVAEMLRLSSPVQYVARQLREEMVLTETRLPAGPVVLLLGAANLDPAAFPDPLALRPERSGPMPLAFAAGPYRCLGAQLAQFEVELAMDKLLAWPGLTLAGPPKWATRTNIAPLLHLPARFT